MPRFVSPQASGRFLRGLVSLAVLSLFISNAGAREFDFEERMAGMGLEEPNQPNNTLEFGFLSSGGSESDLEDGIFTWDYATYLYYRSQIDEKTRLRFNHQFYRYLDGEYRNTYSVDWRRELQAFHAFSISGEVSSDSTGYSAGTAYFGYQGLRKPDLQWYVRAGAGAAAESEVHRRQ